MKMTFHKHLLALAAAGVFSLAGAGAVAQGDEAASLDQLLQMVKESKIAETKEYQQREAEFRRQKANQAELLRQAEQTLANEEARAARLDATFEEQELVVQQKRQQLEERLGSLKELFGHLTSTAGDLRAALETSIVSAQYPNRTAFLDELIDKMNSETRLPTIAEIERLWFEMQRETIESGKIVSFTATVASPQGEKEQREVVRIGNYNLVSDGKYLTFDPKSGTIAELTRQPEGGIQSSAKKLQAAESGFTKVGVDPTGPTGGSFLSALINSPSLTERWHQGGIVGYIISVVGLFAVILALWRFLALSGITSKVNAQMKSDRANTNNPLGRVLKVAEDNPGIDTESLELKLEEAVLKERPPIEAGLTLLKIISMVAPLLGLLGTVTGMIQTFQAITVFGAGDPKAMAGGISAALVTTVLGLVVAIPTVLLHTWLNGKAKRVIHILDERSAGIIAEKSEK
jgi:biopolymer transport protein ExbB